MTWSGSSYDTHHTHTTSPSTYLHVGDGAAVPFAPSDDGTGMRTRGNGWSRQGTSSAWRRSAVVTLGVGLMACGPTDAPVDGQPGSQPNADDAASEPDPVAVVVGSGRVVIVDEPACAPQMSHDELIEHTRSNPESLDWLDGYESPTHDDIQAVGTLVQPPSDDTGEAHPAPGFLGYDLDYELEQIVVVTDPGQDTDTMRIATELDDATSTARIRIQPGCNSLSDLRDVEDTLLAPGFFSDHAGDEGGGFSFGIDAMSGTIHISTSSANQEWVDHVTEQFGDLVTVETYEGMMTRLPMDGSADAPTGR